MNAQLMTQADFARHRGVTRPAVSNWKKQGLLVFAEGPDGRVYVDVTRSELKLNAKIDPMRGRPTAAAPSIGAEEAGLPTSATSAGDTPSLANERLELIREQRIGQRLKNGRESGELVPLIEAERRVAEIGRSARERMQAWLRSMAERFAAERDARTIMSIGEAGIDAVFAELADAARSGLVDDDGQDDEIEDEEPAAIGGQDQA